MKKLLLLVLLTGALIFAAACGGGDDRCHRQLLILVDEMSANSSVDGVKNMVFMPRCSRFQVARSNS